MHVQLSSCSDSSTDSSTDSSSEESNASEKKPRLHEHNARRPSSSSTTKPCARNPNPGRRKHSGRTYDSWLGITCHFCRQKTVEDHALCYKCVTAFCGRCLKNRHGEDIKLETAKSGQWVCPKCRGGCGPGCKNCCNCGPCRKARGLQPTRSIMHTVHAAGFTNVHDYLIYVETREDQTQLSKRKWGKGWCVSGCLEKSKTKEEHKVVKTEEEQVGKSKFKTLDKHKVVKIENEQVTLENSSEPKTTEFYKALHREKEQVAFGQSRLETVVKHKVLKVEDEQATESSQSKLKATEDKMVKLEGDGVRSADQSKPKTVELYKVTTIEDEQVILAGQLTPNIKETHKVVKIEEEVILVGQSKHKTMEGCEVVEIEEEQVAFAGQSKLDITEEHKVVTAMVAGESKTKIKGIHEVVKTEEKQVTLGPESKPKTEEHKVEEKVTLAGQSKPQRTVGHELVKKEKEQVTGQTGLEGQHARDQSSYTVPLPSGKTAIHVNECVEVDGLDCEILAECIIMERQQNARDHLNARNHLNTMETAGDQKDRNLKKSSFMGQQLNIKVMVKTTGLSSINKH